MAKRKNYHVEITDTFAGEANYSWVRRYRVQASSAAGAIRMINRDYGYGFRREYDMGDCVRYKLPGACVCAFVTYDPECVNRV